MINQIFVDSADLKLTIRSGDSTFDNLFTKY